MGAAAPEEEPVLAARVEAELERLESTDLGEHPAVFERLAAELAGELASLPDGEGASAPAPGLATSGPPDGVPDEQGLPGRGAPVPEAGEEREPPG